MTCTVINKSGIKNVILLAARAIIIRNLTITEKLRENRIQDQTNLKKADEKLQAIFFKYR